MTKHNATRFYFQETMLAERCSLNEALLWVWQQRLPVESGFLDNAFAELSDWQCADLGIPPVPGGAHRAAHYRTPEQLRRQYNRIKIKAYLSWQIAQDMQEAQEVKTWLTSIEAAIEVPAIDIFSALRKARLPAYGKLLPPHHNVIDYIENERSYSNGDDQLNNLLSEPVPAEMWTLRGIDWLANALKGSSGCYCDVRVPVDELMSVFPVAPDPIAGVAFVGPALVWDSNSSPEGRPRTRGPGKPVTIPWDRFHVEVAFRLERLPSKMEAGIAEMQEWFRHRHHLTVSRTAVLEKLSPYYERLKSKPVANSGAN